MDLVICMQALQCVLPCQFVVVSSYGMHMGAVLILDDPWVREACHREAACRRMVISKGLVPLELSHCHFSLFPCVTLNHSRRPHNVQA